MLITFLLQAPSCIITIVYTCTAIYSMKCFSAATDGLEIIYNFKLKNFVYLNLWCLPIYNLAVFPSKPLSS